MTKLHWSPQAVRDLEAIRDYIATDSPRYAALVIERIIVAVERLPRFLSPAESFLSAMSPRFARSSSSLIGWSTDSNLGSSRSQLYFEPHVYPPRWAEAVTPFGANRRCAVRSGVSGRVACPCGRWLPN